MFIASDRVDIVEEIDSSFTVCRWNEIETASGWVYAENIKIGDKLHTDEADVVVTSVVKKDDTIILGF